MNHRFNPDHRHRRSIRLRGYDYRQAGAYFVTVCTHQRESIFGAVVDGEMQVNAAGEIAIREWLHTAELRPNVELDAFMVMPNHMHGVIVLTDPPTPPARSTDGNAKSPGDAHPANPAGQSIPLVNAHSVGARRAVPLPPPAPRQFGVSVPGSLPTIVGAYKSAVTKEINRLRDTPGAPVWQRNYYETIIRDEPMLNAIRLYIETNPAAWESDAENIHPFR